MRSAPASKATANQVTFSERRAAQRADVVLRKAGEAFHGRAQRAAQQVAPKYFRAIGHGVVTDEARDLAFAVAREAAVESVNSFDPGVGTTLEQWTARLVARALARAADASFGELVLPRERAAQVRVFRSTQARLYSELGRFPTDAEVVEGATGFTPLILNRVQEADRTLRTTELDAPVKDADGTETRRGSLIADRPSRSITEDIDAENARLRLIHMTSALMDPESRSGRIFRAVHGIDCDKRTLEQLAAEFVISRQRVRQLLDQTVQRLRALDGIDEVRETLDAFNAV